MILGRFYGMNTIQTDHVIEARTANMVIIDKTKNKCKIITLQARLIAEWK